jgi:hypothetical protein
LSGAWRDGRPYKEGGGVDKEADRHGEPSAQASQQELRQEGERGADTSLYKSLPAVSFVSSSSFMSWRLDFFYFGQMKKKTPKEKEYKEVLEAYNEKSKEKALLVNRLIEVKSLWPWKEK